MSENQGLGERSPQRIVILRALQLGDLMCAVPAFRALRAAFPEAVITLVGLPWARRFVERFSYYLDDFIEFPGFPGFPEIEPDIHRFPEFLVGLQWVDFDLALQMQGSGGVSNSLIELFGARLTAGFSLEGQYCPDPHLFLDYPVHESEVWRLLRLMEFLGLPLQGEELEFPLYPHDWREFRTLEDQSGLIQGRYACVHPGARALERRWPVERFAAVADGLAARGYQVVLTGSPEETELTQQVQEQMQAPALNLAGKTSLGALGALLSGARLLVCNDTGVSHMAEALLTPSVVLFPASDPQRWAPKDHNLHRIVAWATAAMPEVVLGEVDELLHEERSYAL